MRTALAAVLLAAASPLASQAPADTVRPGSPVLQTTHLADREETMELTILGANGITLQMVLATRLTEHGGVPGVTRTERLRRGRSLLSTDSMVLVRATLAPMERTLSGGESSRTVFSESGVRVSAGVGKSFSSRLPSPVFLAVAMDMILGALPLAPGYQAVVPVWDSADGRVAMAHVRVVGLDDPGLANGVRSAWRVEVTRAETAGTYWLDRESRTLLRFDSENGRMRVVRRDVPASPSPRASR